MKTPDYAGLKAEDAKAAYLGMADAQRVGAMNAASAAAPVPGRYLAEGGILRVLGPTLGDATLSALESASAMSSLLARAVRILRDTAGGGLDFGDADTRAVLDQLQSQGVLTAEAVAGLKAYGEDPGPSIVNSLGFPSITTADLAHARTL